MAITIEDISWALREGNLSRHDIDPEELDHMVTLFNGFVKEARKNIAAKVLESLAPGMRVKMPTKRGATTIGIVVKVKRTRAYVEDADGTIWDTPMAGLKIIT